MYGFILKYVNKFLGESLHIFQDNYLIILVSISFNSFFNAVYKIHNYSNCRFIFIIIKIITILSFLF